MAANPLKTWETDPFVTPWPEMRPFWAAAAEGRFLMPKCGDCGKYHWHPRAVCPFCHSQKIEWIESPGRGTIFSFSIARTWSPPHAIAFVKTQEGPVILTQLVDCDFDALRIDLPVRVKLAPVEDGRSMPFFTPER
jgi:uncharacterized OB-fold protein